MLEEAVVGKRGVAPANRVPNQLSLFVNRPGVMLGVGGSLQAAKSNKMSNSPRSRNIFTW